MAKILDVTDLVVNHGVSVSSVLLMLICSIPSFLVFIVAMSVMMGVLLASLGLSSDNEITAIEYKRTPSKGNFCIVEDIHAAEVCVY
jgi:lipopolysaccharide export system permease protein